MSIFDDIMNDRDLCGKNEGFAACDCEEDGCFHDLINDIIRRRRARLDRLERIALAANRLEMVADCVSKILDSPEQGVSFELARDLRVVLDAFRTACEAGQ